MIYLATLPTDERALLPALAEATDAPESFLSKVLQALAHARLITSRRGKSGGFSILPRGREASMYEVIEAIDGAICLNVCLSGTVLRKEVLVSGASGLGAGPAGDAGCAFETMIAELASKASVNEARESRQTLRFTLCEG